MKREVFSYVFAVDASDVAVAVMIIYVGLRGVPRWCDRFLSAVSPFLSHPQNSEISVFETQCRFRTPAPHITHTMLLEVSVALFTVLCLRLLVRRVQGPPAPPRFPQVPGWPLIGQAITKFCLTGRPGSELDVVGQAITKFCKWWYS